MLTPTKAWKDSSGTAHASLEEAQIAELNSIAKSSVEGTCESSDINAVVTAIVHCKDKVLDVLTTKDGSRPVARKVNGGKKPRKAKPEDAQQQISI